MGRRCAATPLGITAAGPVIPSKKDDSTAASGGASTERELRAKYFDWCSARIAERFVNLSVQEIYALADAATLTADEDRSFQVVMDRATAVLAAQTILPSFDQWVLAYRSDPAGYDADLIGFWREEG